MDINIKEFMNITPEELSEKQHNVLKEAVINRLRDIAILMQNEKYEAVLDCLGYSPSGDSHGCDNHYITFDDILEEKGGDGSDIETVVTRLSELKKIYSREG